MIGALSAELLKLRKSWSTWILGGILVLGLLLLGYLLIYLLVQNPPPGIPVRSRVLPRSRPLSSR